MSSDLFDSTALKWQDVGFVQHWAAIAVISAFCIFGIVLSGGVGIAMTKNPILFESFAFLSSAQAFCDMAGFIDHLFVSIPQFAMRDRVVNKSGHVPGLFVSTFGLTLFYLQTIIVMITSLSRYVAIAKPMRYRVWFTVKRCKGMVLMGTIYSMFVASIFYVCPMWFDTKHYFLTHQLDSHEPTMFGYPCGYATTVSIYVAGTPPFLAAVVLIAMSVLKLKKRATVGIATPGMKTKRTKQERALKQTAYNCTIQFILIPIYNVVTPVLAYFEFKLLCLFSGLGVWLAIHMTNNLVLFVNNKSVRDFLLCSSVTKVGSTAASRERGNGTAASGERGDDTVD